MLDLAGDWTLSDESGVHVVPFRLPGDGVTALQAAGAIADPYWGRNEYDCRWVCEQDWVARRAFDHPGGAADLVIEGLDCVAEVSVNGVRVLSAANTHRRWRVRVELLRGPNAIEIVFRSSVREAAARQAAMPFYVPYQQVNGPIPFANMLRKQQCDFGWDWNIALGQFGVGAVRLEAAIPARIEAIFVDQMHRLGVATVRVRAVVQCAAAGPVVYSFGFAGQEQQGHLATVAGENELTLEFEVADPDLWWPNGQGKQSLYTLDARVGPTQAAHFTSRRIGLRDLALVSAPDASGRSFGFCVNGRDVFAKGANWIPADALNGRITQTSVRGLLQSAVDANMNMIRVWGGGRYEPDWFYDLCDEMGLMVWQDFMFACHLYPSTPGFLAEVDAEVRDVVGRIGHHACLALWCGDNELIGALNWFPESRKDRDRYLVSYDRLNRTIEAALRDLLPGANWWPSSPSPGPMAFGDAWHDDRSGDMHFWSVWHEGRDFDHYREVKPRFCSEFGFQSYPSMSAIRRFAAPEDMNISSLVMESHQKNTGGNARIAETMFRYFRFPVGFENFVYLSQVQQSLAIKTAVTTWRSLKPHCMGALYWQLNDTWPVCSWSGLDHGGNWKLLHHAARHFYQPVLVTAVPGAEGIKLMAVNDRLQAVKVAVRAMAVDMAGRTRLLAEGLADVAASAEPLCVIPFGDLRADEMLAYDWQGSDGTSDRDVFAPRPYKSYDLVPSGLRVEVDGARITLTTQALALFVAIEADVPGRFSDNGFAMLPGQPLTLSFAPEDETARPAFTFRELHSATYGPQ